MPDVKRRFVRGPIDGQHDTGPPVEVHRVGVRFADAGMRLVSYVRLRVEMIEGAEVWTYAPIEDCRRTEDGYELRE